MTGGFGSIRSLGERQLQIQFTLSSMYDTQAVGILGLNGALLAAAIAAKDFLGHLWWLALIGLAASSVSCIAALRRGGSDGVGPEIDTLFGEAAILDADEMNKVVATGISEAWKNNNLGLQTKRKFVGIALALLGLTILAAAFAALAL